MGPRKRGRDLRCGAEGVKASRARRPPSAASSRFGRTPLLALSAEGARESIGEGGVLEVKLGGRIALIIVALDPAREPQLAMRRTGKHRLTERAVGHAERDRLDSAAVVAGGDQPQMTAA